MTRAVANTFFAVVWFAAAVSIAGIFGYASWPFIQLLETAPDATVAEQYGVVVLSLLMNSTVFGVLAASTAERLWKGELRRMKDYLRSHL